MNVNVFNSVTSSRVRSTEMETLQEKKSYYYITKLVRAVIGQLSGLYSPARTAKI